MISITNLGLATLALTGALATGCTRTELAGETTSDGGEAGAKQAQEATHYDGPRATDFTLADTNGVEHTLSDYTNDGQVVVLEWFNPDCPVSKAYHSPEHKMVDLYAEIGDDDVTWLAINSGAPGKQGNGLDRNKQAVADYAMTYPVLLDEDGTVGKAYGAKTTPHMYVITPDMTIIYAGAIDGSKAGKPDVNFVRQCLDEYRAGEPISEPSTQAFGCSVKYAN